MVRQRYGVWQAQPDANTPNSSRAERKTRKIYLNENESGRHVLEGLARVCYCN